MNFLSGLYQQAITQPNMPSPTHGQMIVRSDFRQPVSLDSTVFLSLELAVTVGFDPVVTLMADVDALVVLDVLIPVALSMNIDLLLPGPVLDAQFIGAPAAWAAEGLEHAARLVRGQFIGRNVLGVIQAAADQRPVRVAVKKSHQHFHADSRDDHAAITIARPARRHPQPAAALA